MIDTGPKFCLCFLLVFVVYSMPVHKRTGESHVFAVIMTTDPVRVLSHHHSAEEAVQAALKARAAATPEEAPLIVPVAMDDGAYVEIPFPSQLS